MVSSQELFVIGRNKLAEREREEEACGSQSSKPCMCVRESEPSEEGRERGGSKTKSRDPGILAAVMMAAARL